MKLSGKIALVTGGSRGIGRATALAFAAEGADIAFCHLNDDAKADDAQLAVKMMALVQNRPNNTLTFPPWSPWRR